MKLCRKCNVTRPFEHFHRCRANKDGYQSYCKPCNVAQGMEWQHKNPKLTIARVRRYQMKAVNRKKKRATNAVYVAVKSGKLVRQPCEECGELKVEAHHTSYAKAEQLNVMWLCRTHHSAWHLEHGEAK